MSLERFVKPLRPNEVEWKIQSKTRKGNTLIVPYIDARAVFTRLDDCFGAMFWKNEIKEVGGGFLAGISIDVSQSGEWTTKWDGASHTNIEPVKGGLSDAMKRAAHLWGLGRELYNNYPSVQVEGEHKFIPDACEAALDVIVNAVCAGHNLSGKWVTITADGKSNFSSPKPICTPTAFLKVITRVLEGETEVSKKARENFFLTSEQDEILKILESTPSKKAAA